jgi:poly(beta-D-mannuronate) lyase
MMKMKVFVQVITCLLVAGSVSATSYLVSAKTDLQNKMTTAVPGDTVFVANGSYNWDVVSFTNTNGTSSSAAIVLKAQTVPGVIFTGTTRIAFKGIGVVVDGFKFQNGDAGTNPVVSFRSSSSNLSSYSRVTNITIDNYNTYSADSSTENEWIGIYGTNNRVDHCTFINKYNARATVVVWYSSTTYPNPAISTYHRIDSNYFKGRSYQGANGGETIRVGDSNSSRTNGFNVIEYNMFEDCTQDEPEIISNKSDFNTYRYNTFRNSKGGLTLRHGRYCDVYGNFFIVTNNTTDAYGVRAIDRGHRIYNNYFEGLTGNASGGTSQLRAPINLYNGVSTDTTDAASASLYFPADSCIVAFNTIVNAKGGGGIVLGGTGGGTIQPKGVVLANNLVKMATGTALYRNPTNTSLTYSSEGNIYDAPNGIGDVTTGWQSTALTFGARDSGILKAPSLVQDMASNTSLYATMLAGVDVQGQTRSAVYDVGCDELNGTGKIIRQPLTAGDVGAGTSATLPVTLINFNAAVSGIKVVLTWIAADEINMRLYEVEYSTSGVAFEKAGELVAQNTGSTASYSFEHLPATTGKLYYRLKSINVDGSFRYSIVRTIEFSSSATTTIFPNPAKSFVNIKSTSVIKSVSVKDLSGAVKRTFNVGSFSYRLSTNGLASGTYVLQVTDANNSIHTHKLIIKH